MEEHAIVHIDAIAAGGAGVGRVDGLAVFVPRTAPGDTVEATLRRHRRHAEGRLRQLLSPGPARIPPACRHYDRDRCGGCQIQHLAYDAQVDAKRNIVRQALRRIGRRDVAIDAVTPAPSPWHYRNKLTLTLRREGDAWRAGLRPYDAPDEIFQLEECPITSERVLAAWQEVMAASDVLPAGHELRGAMREAEIGCVLHLVGGTEWPHAQGFAGRCPSLTAIRWEDAAGRVHAIRDDHSGASSVSSFEQVNPDVASLLHDRVAERLRAVNPRRVIDAYGGRGAIAMRVAAPQRELVLIELDAEATRLARNALGESARVVTARVEDQLPVELPADAVVLNPPRAGVDARVCAALERAGTRPRILVYVSCDPATLARDLTRLPSYRVASCSIFDMFPQTAHVETFCELVPDDA